MSNITKNHKVGIFAIFIATALVLGTVSASGFDPAFATKDKSKDYKKSSNIAEQSIAQSQSSNQDSACLASGTENDNPGQGQGQGLGLRGAAAVIAFSCNNDSSQANLNFGDNTVGQR